jgi:sigma-B regulation protein RsbU (phosphoserine phosphatase)
MPALVLLKSPLQPPPVEEVELSTGPLVIGKLATDCQLVLASRVISKQHARITLDGETFYLEDLKSLNGTYLNGTRLTPHTPRPLKPDDEIRICDFLFQYRAEDERVSVEISQDFLVAPGDRLQALLALGAGSTGSSDLGPLRAQIADTLFSTNLEKTLELEPLLNQIADTLLAVFKEAVRCFVLLLDDTGRPTPKVVKCRRGKAAEARFSRGIVRKAVESMRSYLATDTPGSTGAEPRSVMCVPLATSDGRAFGAIELETRDRSERFTAAELNLLTIVANLASVSVERVQLHEKAQEQAVTQSQINLAREVQRGFLPRDHPVVTGYEFHSHYSPAQTVGGDFYDFVPLSGGRVAVVLGDVAGKGVPAALLVAKLSSEVRFCLLSEPDPARAVSLLNAQMSEALQDRFVTMAVMVLDPVAHRMTVVSAGHTSPKVYRSALRTLSDAIALDPTGVPLGVERKYKYVAVTVPLEPGDTVIAYTDGVTDAMNPAGKTFGPRAVEKYLTPPEGHGPDAARPKRVVEALMNAVRKHARGRPQSDDIALVCFGRWDPSSESNTTLNGQGSAGSNPPA